MKRILLVEDNPKRVEFFKQHMLDCKIVHARTGGQALGILRKDGLDNYVGVMLDHDLELTSGMRGCDDTNGYAVARAISRLKAPDLELLVHSMNDKGATRMVETLEGAGFTVTRIPFANMSADRLRDWVDSLAEL